MLFSPVQIRRSGLRRRSVGDADHSGEQRLVCRDPGSGVAVTQNGDAVTIVGDLTDVNNALDNGITYTPVGSSNTLTLSVTDGSETPHFGR